MVSNMNKVLKMLLAISLIMIPANVMAMTETELEMLPMLIFMEAFVSIHCVCCLSVWCDVRLLQHLYCLLPYYQG